MLTSHNLLLSNTIFFCKDVKRFCWKKSGDKILNKVHNASLRTTLGNKESERNQENSSNYID